MCKGKEHQESIGTLELIHSDVCGPMSSTSLSGFEYYITFIDDFSRKTWIYFLKAKGEVFEKFKEFKALIEIFLTRKSRFFDQTMEENTPQKSLRLFAKMQE